MHSTDPGGVSRPPSPEPDPEPGGVEDLGIGREPGAPGGAPEPESAVGRPDIRVAAGIAGALLVLILAIVLVLLLL